MRHAEILHTYIHAFVDELVASGLQDVCICPGSRSTPLAMVLAARSDMRAWRHIDERSAAFFALGLAKAGRKPVAILSTSGTATANFFPAIIEAHYGRVPLIVLTADRPHELRDCGAPQAIDQIRMYGTHVKWSVDVAQPEETPDMLRYIRTTACRAVATSLAGPAGPVHLNFPLREPLVPLTPTAPAEAAWAAAGSRVAGHVSVTQASRQLPPNQVEVLSKTLLDTDRGLIVCGPQDDPSLGAAAVRLAGRLGFPVLADPLSQVRCGTHDLTTVVDKYDAFLRVPEFTRRAPPDLILRVGAMPISKPFLLYVKNHPECRQIIVDDGEGWNEPTALASDVIYADPGSLLVALAETIEAFTPGPRETDWTRLWAQADSATGEAVQRTLERFEETFEGRIFSELAHILPDNATLFAGNSMPVRDLDTFFPAQQRHLRFLANRGANGIDGVVSSALGAAAASQDPVVLVIGDLSFFHDLNGLLAAKLHQIDATIVLINNDGGGIFSFLPQASYPEHFEFLFGTPTGLDFAAAVNMYGGHFATVATWADFAATTRDELERPGLSVVEVRTERSSNAVMHRAVWNAVSQAIAPVLGGEESQ